MSSPPPRTGLQSALAWLWKITSHQVIGGLVTAGILAVIGVLFATSGNGNGNEVPSLGAHASAPPSTTPSNNTTNRDTTPPTAPAPRCPAATAAAATAGPVQDATGPPPWTVAGYGFRYTVISVTRTTSSWAGQSKPSITVTSCVTRTEPSNYSNMMYRISDQASSSVLDSVPLQGSGDGNPPPHQVSRLISVVWDIVPQATRLTIIVHNFYLPDSSNLILRNVLVPSSS
jgi:hypothetical protein